jgi:hypothetical protein
MNCNTGLGHLKDDPIALRRAVGYLSSSSEESDYCI